MTDLIVTNSNHTIYNGTCFSGDVHFKMKYTNEGIRFCFHWNNGKWITTRKVNDYRRLGTNIDDTYTIVDHLKNNSIIDKNDIDLSVSPWTTSGYNDKRWGTAYKLNSSYMWSSTMEFILEEIVCNHIDASVSTVRDKVAFHIIKQFTGVDMMI